MLGFLRQRQPTKAIGVRRAASWNHVEENLPKILKPHLYLLFLESKE
jgi:hypothetical protein